MVELWVDGKKCDIDSIPTIPIGFDIEKLHKVDGGREERYIDLVLPTTPLNNKIFGASRDIYATARFNMEHHLAVVKKEGVNIFEGTVHLYSTTIKSDIKGEYLIRIYADGHKWIESVIKHSLSELDIPFSGALNISTITDSWGENQAVRFLPVCREGDGVEYSSSSTLPVERVMLTDDYHPFISVSEMIKAMFAESGYKLRSNFLDSEFGQSLYMSGDYARSDASSAKAKCDFFARRSAPATATADFFGRVYASTAFATHTVGAIVDTANPNALDSNGVQMIDTFNTLNAFSKNSVDNICFTPQCSVKAGFLLHLEYTTDYRILSRDKFVGFDTVAGLDGVQVEFSLANTCKDYRYNPSTSWLYRVVVFDHVEGREYNLVANSGTTFYDMGKWSARSTIISTPTEPVTLLKLYYRDNTSNSWSLYSQDWALYNGYVEESGKVDVKMDLRLPPQEINAGESFVLDKIWFGGAENNMELTVGSGTTLRPYFTTVPGYGSTLTFKDIAPRQIGQADLLTAVGEMFNLVFYTDEVRKEVWIEPLEEFYDNGEVIDWNNRVDHLNGVAISDIGLEQPQDTLLSYIDADRASHQFNLENDTVLGSWSLKNPLFCTKKSVRKLGDKLFTTSLNRTNVVSCAPSASLIQVGDIGDENVGIDVGFTSRIVCYKGMRLLPNGECWIASDRLKSYPYAAFIDNNNVNLGFADCNDIEGLHRYHQQQLNRQCESQNITLDLHLTTAEMAFLFTAEGTKPSLRKRFRFDILGESSLFRLVKIEKWDTERGVVRCIFERELKDGL